MTANNLLKEKREEILRIAAKYGAHDVRVFGSAARGETGQNSDIDFLVDMEPGRFLICVCVSVVSGLQVHSDF